MASSSSSSSSSSSLIRKYDVFLSFRGPETGKTFVSHLYHSLERRRLRTFKDARALGKDVPLSPADLSQAINASKIAVVVISENYASSIWCLEELSTIIEFQQKSSIAVVPIYYKVEPTHVHEQSGTLFEQFKIHEGKENRERVKRWRSTLTKLREIPGNDSRTMSDAELVEKITVDISGMLGSSLSSVVGMDRHMKAIYELLDLGSTEEVRTIAITGMGGVGKSTLASYVYEEISHNFHSHVLVEDVSKIYPSARFQGVALQRRHSDIDIQSRLQNRKGLLIADGVEDVRQLTDIKEDARTFGPGSRVIITTREKDLLVSSEIKHIYEVECLRFDDALQLFCQSAFKKTYPPPSFERLSVRAVELAGCLPLALKILGSVLQGQGETEWKAELDRLEAKQDQAVTEFSKIIRGVAYAQD